MARTPTDSPGDTLSAVEAALAAKRQAEAELLLLAAAWADQHPGDTAGRFGYTPRGGEQALHIGGEGTPTVAEFSSAELAISLEVHPLAARSLMADALDLRHRLPETWHLVTRALALPDWVARKIARATRGLSLAQAAEIDERVALEACELPIGRLLTVVEALVLAASTEEADRDRRHRLAQRFVTISDDRRRDERRLPMIYGSLAEEDAVRLEDTLRRLAAALKDDASESLGVRRSRALGLLADPARAQNLLDGGSLDDETGRRLAPPVTLYLHLTDTAFTRDADGVARFEQGRPLTLAHAREILGHGNVTIRPVLDLERLRPADAYEFTGSLREGIRLRTPADCYPYATRVGRALSIDLDVDHTDAWAPTGSSGGPPGQTVDANAGPMTRHHHRIKTHGSMAVRQPRPGLYVWRTPGRRYLATDHRGTRRIDPVFGDDIFSGSAARARLATILLDWT